MINIREDGQQVRKMEWACIYLPMEMCMRVSSITATGKDKVNTPGQMRAITRESG